MDNIYFYIGESLDIMALVILLIICAGHLYGYLNSPLFRIYTGLILASAVYVGAGGLLYHLLRMGVGHSSPLFRFTVCLISTSYYTVTIMYVRYILEYISSYRSPLSKRPFYLSLAIAIPASLFWIIMYLNGLLMNASTLNLEGIRVLSFTSGYAVTAISVYLLLRYRRDLPVKNTLLLLFMMLSPLLTSLLRALNPHPPYLQMLVMLSALILNNYFNRDLHYRLQEQEKRLQEARVQLMISQVQPHFIFNVLNTIYSLCDVSASQARHAIDEFSQYLRINLEVLDDSGLVPIDRELEYLGHYLTLEKMRYGEDLTITYDISPCRFFLPPLTLQPIVENAVRHGLGKKTEGGTVKIKVREHPSDYRITVADDGIGFDVNAKDPFTAENSEAGYPGPENRGHVGLRNTRERIRFMCHGDLTVRSRPGKGTKVTISIPKS